MCSSDAARVCEGSAGNGHDADGAGVDIPGERKQNGLLLGSPQLFAENAAVKRVDELEFGEVRSEKRRLVSAYTIKSVPALRPVAWRRKPSGAFCRKFSSGVPGSPEKWQGQQ